MLASLTVEGRVTRSNVHVWIKCIMLPSGPDMVIGIVVGQMSRTRACVTTNVALLPVSEIAKL